MSYIDTGRFEFPIKTVSTVKSVYIQTALMHDKWSGSSHLVCRIWVSKSFLLNKQQLSRKYTQVHTSTHTHRCFYWSVSVQNQRLLVCLFVQPSLHGNVWCQSCRSPKIPTTVSRQKWNRSGFTACQSTDPQHRSRRRPWFSFVRLSQTQTHGADRQLRRCVCCCEDASVTPRCCTVCYFLGRVALPRVR